MTTRKSFLSLLAALAAVACLFTAQSALAAIVGPYTVDANTVNLWHMDEASNPPVNAVGGGITLQGAGNPGALNQAAYDGTFGTAGRINRPCCGNGGSDERGWTNNGAVSASTVLGSTGGAFTIEMLLNFQGPLTNDFTEIFRTSSTDFRGRRIDGTSSGFEKLSFNVPNFNTFTTDDLTINTGTWYHMAMVYDGNGTTTDNVRIYFTEMNPATTAATAVGTFSASLSDVYGITDFQLGSASGGQMNAFIDEIRISDIARSDTDMMFNSGQVPEPSSMVLAGLGLIGLVGFGLRRRKK